MNRWKIPSWLEAEVRERDQACVYCRLRFDAASKATRANPTWEHIVNDARIVTRENIALCCGACNASKGNRELSAWLESKYCKERGINAESVSSVVKMALLVPPRAPGNAD